MKHLLARKVLPETVLMVVICGLDTFYTLYAVNMGFAKESNPFLAGALAKSDVLFIVLKGVSFLIPLVVLELLRQRFPNLIPRALRLGIVGYVAIYVVGIVMVCHRIS